MPVTSHLESLPTLPEANRGRVIYVDCLPDDLTAELEVKGYGVVDLFTLPRDTLDEEQTYLRAKCQAIEEGTIAVNSHILRALEIGMRAAGMMGRETRHAKVTLEGDHQSVEELMGWGKDRHTLEGNSTIVNAQRKK